MNAKKRNSTGKTPSALSIAAYWDRRSTDYDVYYETVELRKLILLQMENALLELGPRFLNGVDLGCGTGRLTQVLAGCCESIVAVDISPAMIEIAKARVQGNSASIEWCTQDVTAFLAETNDGAFNVCTAGLLTHQLNKGNKKLFFQEVFRVLRDGGILAISDQIICSRDIESGGNPEERRRSLRAHIESEFYHPDRLPTTFDDSHEFTDTDVELYEQLRAAGFGSVTFQRLSALVGLFFARKSQPRMIQSGFQSLCIPQLHSISSLPPELASRYTAYKADLIPDTDGLMRFIGMDNSDGGSVIIDIAKAASSDLDLLQKQVDVLRKVGNAAKSMKLESRFVLPTISDASLQMLGDLAYCILKFGEDVPDISGEIHDASLYRVVDVCASIFDLLSICHSHGVFGFSPACGLAITRAGTVIAHDAKRVSLHSSTEDRVSDDIRAVGRFLVNQLIRMGGAINQGALSASQSFNPAAPPIGFPVNIPPDLVRICTILTNRDHFLTAGRAYSALGRFLSFAKADIGSGAAVVAANREFVSMLESHTLGAFDVDQVWKSAESVAAHREALYYLFREYRSWHSASNVLQILLKNDHGRFAEFTARHLQRRVFRGLDLRDVDLDGWNLEECEFRACQFLRVNLKGALLHGSIMHNCIFTDCNLTQVSGMFSSLIGSEFRHSRLDSADFSFANFERTKMLSCSVSSLSLEGANLWGANLLGGSEVDSVRLLHSNKYDVVTDSRWKSSLSSLKTLKCATYGALAQELKRIYGSETVIRAKWLNDKNAGE